MIMLTKQLNYQVGVNLIRIRDGRDRPREFERLHKEQFETESGF